MEDRERFPGNCGWEFGVLLRLRISLMANASPSGEMHHRGQSLRLRNLLIYIEMASRRTVLQTKLPACHSQQDGRLPVSWHTKGLSLGREYFKAEMTKMADSIYEEPRAMPSFCILNWRVDRFIARRAAAPFGPATTQLHSLRVLRICWRSVSSKTI
jgi:hypothetical protein